MQVSGFRIYFLEPGYFFSKILSEFRKKIVALHPEAQENYMINLAMKLVEKRLLEGTASSAETTHFLKLATSKNELEKTKLEEENKLLRAKTETLQNAKHSEEMYEKAIAAMKKYNGLGEDDEYDGI